jgi:hypothetical protein
MIALTAVQGIGKWGFRLCGGKGERKSRWRRNAVASAMRVAVGGFLHETNTFSRIPTATACRISVTAKLSLA